MKLIGQNKSLNQQIVILKEILLQNKELKKVLEILKKSNLDNYYIAAGSINQTVFNYYTNRELNYGISDYDIVYFDNDTSYEAEDKIIKELTKKLKRISKEVDIKNQARVHLWYENKFGSSIQPFNSVEHAISNWYSTITCVGVRLENDNLIVCAPYGLNDLFNLTIRPVKGESFTEEIYNKKVDKWTSKWPELKFIKWNE